ncbi:hypothetical protein OFL77_27330, partial [Escherichia coli]|uniref:hypothetical protein n=1 Tax=Escherichia coli TaxID=562 RepID=UPI0021E0F944
FGYSTDTSNTFRCLPGTGSNNSILGLPSTIGSSFGDGYGLVRTHQALPNPFTASQAVVAISNKVAIAFRSI